MSKSIKTQSIDEIYNKIHMYKHTFTHVHPYTLQYT